MPDAFATLLTRLEAVLAERGEALTAEVRAGLTAAMPSLRAFALSLTRNHTRADDLVQETLLRAWRSRESFQAGTRLNAWLFMIMRNAFYSDHRKRKWEFEDVDGEAAARLSTAPSQGDKLDLQDMLAALQQLSEEQREAIVLICLNSMSYEEAAAVMACKLGTLKSRVSRGRERLAELLSYTAAELGNDGLMLAVTTEPATMDTRAAPPAP
ncbi:sigma-70 family RNA polymerase sigma factor [Methylobacterium iners]|uniref:sigma-70 family RNA polymerase sigma factor n=1 Tax=Methylobacterium iners TaxID=418707 RepID=UPI001EE34DB0|nr:sigma-70 family RNA polymerase sigma factor [Methylobacterium iners]